MENENIYVVVLSEGAMKEVNLFGKWSSIYKISVEKQTEVDDELTRICDKK